MRIGILRLMVPCAPVGSKKYDVTLISPRNYFLVRLPPHLSELTKSAVALVMPPGCEAELSMSVNRILYPTCPSDA